MKTIRLHLPQPATTPGQFRVDMKTQVGEVKADIDVFSSGMRIVVFESLFEQPTLVQNVSSETVGFGFCLAGRFEARADCFKAPLTINAGECGFFTVPMPIDVFEKIDNRRLHRIYLVMECDQLLSMVQGDEDRFYPVLKHFEKKTFCRMANSITPVMKAILHQMLHCPYHGMTRRIFLEGKAMELLAHKLEQIYPEGSSKSAPIKSSDTERIQHAADLLVHELDNPPDIMTLAQSSGLSRTKLFRGFRRTFGLSPLEFLRNQRLQMAMQLLQSGEANVTQASLMVGYTNLSYFAKAFKSMFGILPGELCRPSAPSPPE